MPIVQGAEPRSLRIGFFARIAANTSRRNRTRLRHSHRNTSRRVARSADLLYGLIAAPILITAGIMISLTGWARFSARRFIVMGILAPLAGPLFAW